MKKETIKKWQNEFSWLAKFKSNKLYCITGPFILGIELIKLPRVDNYRPHFVIYSLYGLPKGTSLKDCLSYPVIMFEFYDERGLQFNLDYEQDITSVVKSIKKFLTFNLGENILKESLFDWLNDIIKNPKLKMRIQIPQIWEVRFNLALYLSREKASIVLDEFKKNIIEWNVEKDFKYYGGFDTWFNVLDSKDRSEHIRIITKNRTDDLLKKLQYFDII